MKKKILLYASVITILFFFEITNSFGQDTAIIITNAKHVYTFIKDKEKGVIVRELKETKYKNKATTQMALVEFYDNNSQIVSFSYKANNRTIENIKPIDSYYNTKDVFHSDTRISYFPLDLSANSTVDFRVEKIITKTFYFTNVYFTSNYKAIQKEIVIKIPRWMNVSLKELNFENFDIEKTIYYSEKDDSDIITYKASNLPAMVDEPHSPGNSYIYPHLLFTAKESNNNSSIYFTSTKSQYQWYSKLIEGLKEEQELVITQQVKELTKDLKTDLEKIKNIFYWVQTNIRYIAFEDGIAGFRPDKATEVLRKKYGDCKGMANLTKTLLTAAGFDARLGWIGTNHIAYDYSTPSLAVDNHMICALFLEKKIIFLDATENYLAFNEYAERIQGRQVLIENGDDYILDNVPLGGINANQNIQRKALRIMGKDLIGTEEHIWKGEEKEVLLTNINATKSEVLQENLISLLSNSNTNFSISDLSFSNLDKYDGDLHASFKFNLKNGVDQFDRIYYLSLDLDKEYNDFLIDVDKRQTDLWLPFKTAIIKEIELTIPDNYIVSTTPENLDISSNDYEFNITYEIKGNKIYYKKKIHIINPKIKKTTFSLWNNDIKKLSQNYSEAIILKPKI